MIRLLIADDEDMLRSALVALLNLEPDMTVIAEASTSDAAVALANELRPDIAVLDLEMPPADGVQAARAIQAPTRTVLVTRHARPGVLRRALQAGVSGFVPKSRAVSGLAEVLREVAAGRRHVDPEIAASALTEAPCPLTERELDVLRAARSGESIAEIAAAVHLAKGTVRNYLSTAMSKLDAPSRHVAARRAWEEGWL